MAMPVTASAPPASWRPSCQAEEASCSSNTVAPMITATIGASVSSTGRLRDSAPELYALWPSSAPAIPHSSRAQGSQVARAPTPRTATTSTVALVSAASTP